MRFPWIGILVLGWVFSTHAQTWLPRGGAAGELLAHTAYTLSYNDNHELANWVAYSLRPEHLKDCVGRANNFLPDPILRSGSATKDDYYQTGYDRGHLAPAGDMKWSRQVMRESFYFSNITPQTPSMNRGRWVKLETLIRAWAKGASETVIVTGPILKGDLAQIGPSRVSVPDYHFKTILVNRNGKREAIAFLMPQHPKFSDLKSYVISVRELENLTGMDLFPHLTRKEQDRIEKNIAWDFWNFKATFSYSACSSN